MNIREVVLLDRTAGEVLELVKELRSSGLVQGQDFDFKYQPPVWDNFSGDAVHNKHTVFYFYTEKYATFYQLKWSQ